MISVPTLLGPVAVNDRGATDAPTVLLWPSLFTDHSMWRHQLRPLHEAGWRTLAIDPPGHGQSTGPGRRFTMDECSQVVIDILDALDIHTPVVLAGTSWGGFIAPRVVAAAPERISAMVLFNTSVEAGTRFECTRARLLTKLFAVHALDRLTGTMVVSGLLAAATRRRDRELVDELTSAFLGWDRRSFIDSVHSVLVDRDSDTDLLTAQTLPALIVSGSEDHILPTPHAKRMMSLLPNGRHVEIEGAAHLCPLEEPEQVNALLQDFLQDLPPTAAG